jgi:hypothetical protein
MSDWSDSTEDAWEMSIIDLLQDEGKTIQLLQILDRKVNASSLPASSLIAQLIDSASFPTFFLNWIAHQIQPFIAYRVRDDSDVQPAETRKADSQLYSAHQAESSVTNRIASSTVIILPSSTVGTVSKSLNAPLKPKKRMTTNPVSLSVGAALSGNIASASNSSDIWSGGNIGAAKDNTTETKKKFISASKVGPTGNIDKIHVSQDSSFDVQTHNSSSHAESAQNIAVQSPAAISSAETAYKPSSSSSGESSLRDIKGQAKNNTSIVGSHDFKQGSTLSKASDVRKKVAPYSVQLVPSRVTAPSSNQAVARMSAVLTSLIINQHVTFGDAVLLLAKLCSLSLPGPADGVQVVVTADDGSRFPTLLTSSDLFHLFAVNAVQCLLPVLKILGDPVALGFAESPVLQR